MKSNIIAFPHTIPARDEENSAPPLSPLGELIWEADFLRNGIFCAVLEQIKVVETADWFRARGDDLSRHRASSLDAISERRASGITAAWLETLACLEQAKAAIVHCLGAAPAGFEKEKAAVLAWSADKPCAVFLDLCGRVQTAMEAAHGAQPFRKPIPAADSGDILRIKADPERYGKDLEFLWKVRNLCIPAA